AAQHDNSGKPLLMWLPMLMSDSGVMNIFDVDDPKLEDAYQALINAGADEDGEAARAMTKALMDQAVLVPVSQVEEVYFFNEDVLEAPTFLGGTPLLSYIYDWEPASE